MLRVAEIAESLLLIPLGIYSKNVVGWLLQDHLILKIQLLIVFDALHMAILFTDIFYYSKKLNVAKCTCFHFYTNNSKMEKHEFYIREIERC